MGEIFFTENSELWSGDFEFLLNDNCKLLNVWFGHSEFSNGDSNLFVYGELEFFPIDLELLLNEEYDVDLCGELEDFNGLWVADNSDSDFKSKVGLTTS